jgi:hypothetical protein
MRNKQTNKNAARNSAMSDDKKKPVVLGVDLDGVCADFYGHMRVLTAEWFERPLEGLPEHVSYGLPEWGVTLDTYPSLHRWAVSGRDLFREVPMIRQEHPSRGVATYYHVRAGDRSVLDAAWSYAQSPEGLSLAGLLFQRVESRVIPFGSYKGFYMHPFPYTLVARSFLEYSSRVVPNWMQFPVFYGHVLVNSRADVRTSCRRPRACVA